MQILLRSYYKHIIICLNQYIIYVVIFKLMIFEFIIQIYCKNYFFTMKFMFLGLLKEILNKILTFLFNKKQFYNLFSNNNFYCVTVFIML